MPQGRDTITDATRAPTRLPLPGSRHTGKRKRPRIALLALPDESGACIHGERMFYVDAYPEDPSTFLIETDSTTPETRFHLFVQGAPEWQALECRVCAATPGASKPGYRTLECTATPAQIPLPTAPALQERGPFPADLDHFRTIPFLRSLNREAICPLLNCIRYRAVKAGARLIVQGMDGDVCYFVQRGRCEVVLEKDGMRHPLDVIGEWGFVGEMALLTGEPRSAHVEALTDLELWGINRGDFEALIRVDPSAGAFLTEIVAGRFAGRTLTAERRIGKYVITDILGRGAFAIVYKGFQIDRNRPVAIKMLRHDLALNREFLADFRKEARTIAGFDHANIARVLDLEERYRTVFIVMEFLEGRTLRDLLDGVGRLPVHRALEILIQLSRALGYAHARGVVHGDVNPANIFLLPDGRAKLLDFGLASRCDSQGLLSGTPFYMSPEQIECRPADPRTDIYALGLTAYEMVCGRRPYPDTDAFKAMSLHLEQDIPDPAQVVPDLPKPFREFILKACSRDLEARYRSAGEALQALER